MIQEHDMKKIETTARVLTLAGSISRAVGMAAALECSRNLLMVLDADADADVFGACRDAVRHRVIFWETYGASWQDIDPWPLAVALAYRYITRVR